MHFPAGLADNLHGHNWGDWGTLKVHLGVVPVSLAWHMRSGPGYAEQKHDIDGQCQLEVVEHLLKVRPPSPLW